MMADPRIGVEWFAQRMIDKLGQNGHKRGWEDMDLIYAIDRLWEEAQELEREVVVFDGDHESAEDVIRECADVANFALFIAWQVASYLK
jgi:hypothetical protein